MSFDDDTDVVQDDFPRVMRLYYYYHSAAELPSITALVFVLATGRGPYTLYYDDSYLGLDAV